MFHGYTHRIVAALQLYNSVKNKEINKIYTAQKKHNKRKSTFTRGVLYMNATQWSCAIITMDRYHMC